MPDEQTPFTPATRDDISAAADRIAPHVRATPTVRVAAELAGAPLVLKLDQLQPTGSFKVRGAFSLLTARDVPEAGVVAASGGNFGLAVAYAASVLGHRARIFIPATSPAEKVDRLKEHGAEVEVVDGYYADALAASETAVAETGALRAHAYDQREVVAGQGTVALELDRQLGDVDERETSMLVAVGGAGLIGGVATWFEDRVRTVAVETEGCPTLHRALAAGEPVDVEVGGYAASSLGARRVGGFGFAAARRFVADSVLVTDNDVRGAQRGLWRECRLVAEPGGAAALAAVTSGRYRPAEDERVVVLVCGANTDPGSVVDPSA